MERGFTSMTTSGAARAITSSDELVQDFEVREASKPEQQQQDVQKDSQVLSNTEGTKQTIVDAMTRDVESKPTGLKPTGLKQIALKSAGWENEQPVERNMSSASLDKNIFTKELLEAGQDSDLSRSNQELELSSSLLDSQLDALASTRQSLETLDSKLRLQTLMEEFKGLLERYQQQTLKLAKSFSKVSHNNSTDIDLSALGSVVIQQEDLDGYASGLEQLTHTLTTMESELEAVLRKSEYQELSRQDLEAAHLEMLEHLANTSETRCSGSSADMQSTTLDATKDETVKDVAAKGKHLDRVGELCAKIAQTLGYDDTFVSNIASSARLHDIGKLAIPDTILQKPDRLNADEYATMKMHTLHGARMLANNSNEIIQMAHRIALSHHENWDGTGYPYQLKQKEIAIEGRIAAVADVYDALISSRIYKEAWPKEKAIEQIKSRSGTKFDPTIVEAFLEVIT